MSLEVELPGPPSPLLICERRVSPGWEMMAAAIPWVVKTQSSAHLPGEETWHPLKLSATHCYDTTTQIENCCHSATHGFDTFLAQAFIDRFMGPFVHCELSNGIRDLLSKNWYEPTRGTGRQMEWGVNKLHVRYYRILLTQHRILLDHLPWPSWQKQVRIQ
jgi:hypothetical protein